jgi:hypothetical protein
VDRRRFLLTSLASALTAPLAAEAQPSEKVYRIGILGEKASGESWRSAAGSKVKTS